VEREAGLRVTVPWREKVEDGEALMVEDEEDGGAGEEVEAEGFLLEEEGEELEEDEN